MSNSFEINNITTALINFQYPTITLWSRLEGRPRKNNFIRALRSEVRDPLWMLTKQWQMGEFRGDDAASPAFAKIQYETGKLCKYKALDHDVEEFEEDVPMETKVEHRPLPFEVNGQKISLDIRLLMGRQWIKLINPIGNFKELYLEKYPVKEPQAESKADVHISAHLESREQFAAVAGRCMDGADLYFYLKENTGHHAYDDLSVPEAKKAQIDSAADKFIAWFERLLYKPVPGNQGAWSPPYLEYRFKCSAVDESGEKVLTADEYYHGHLDWYNLDIDKKPHTLGEIENEAGLSGQIKRETLSFIPGPIIFEGMPDTRWWKFEDQATNFNYIKPDTTDIAKLLLIEFGLVYANDWFIIPLNLNAGTMSKIKGLAVTNVFGERIWVEPSGKGMDDDWQRWSMFTLSVKSNEEVPAEMSMLLLPTVPKILEGKHLEAITLIRDEITNMVWAIENIIPLASGDSKPGNEAAAETFNYYKKLLKKEIEDGVITGQTEDYKASIIYKVMNTVPENWIPFIPVHIKNDNRQIQLQRAAMPRVLEGDPEKPVKIQPRTILIREGLDRDPKTAYFIHEEEVPRAGIRISQSYQRTRWYNGKVFTWLGIRKQTGRGEGSSGLAFDQILDRSGRES